MKRYLNLLLITAFFNTLSWIVLIPIWQYPDEQAHFAQVQDTAEFGKVPTSGLDTSREISLSEKILGTERDRFGNNKFTYHPEYIIDYSETTTGLFEKLITNLPISSRTTLVKHESTFNPPVYYLFSALVYKLFYHGNLFTRVFAIRIASSLIFMIMIFFTFKISQIVFSTQPYLQLILPSLVAFKPMLVFSSTGILPDPLVNLLFTITIFLGLKILKEELQKSYSVFLFAILIIGVMIRQHFLLSLPIILTSLTLKAIITKKGRKSLVGLLSFTIAFIIFSSLGTNIPLVSNFRIQEFNSIKLGQLLKPEFTSYLLQVFKHFYKETFAWYWGVYKWLSLTLPLGYYRFIKIVLAICIIGVLINLYRKLRSNKLDLELSYLFLFIFSSILYFLIFVTWDYLFSRSSGYSFGIQGRYFFPLVVAHLAIVVIGLKEIINLFFQKYPKYAIFVIVAVMVIFNDLSLFHVASSFYNTLSLSTFIIQASQYKPLFFKGNTIILVLTISFALQLSLIVDFAKYATKKVDQN